MTITLLEAAETLDAFLAPARDAWNAGEVVHLAICPGDATSYRMTFVPATTHSFATSWTAHGRSFSESAPVGDGDRLLVVHGPTEAVIPVGPHSEPWPSYAAEKLDTRNTYTVMAIGLTWWLMAGCSPVDAEVAYSDLTVPGGSFDGPNPLHQWDLSRFALAEAVA